MTETPHIDSLEGVLLLMQARELAASGRGARLRREAGISQNELAGAIGVTGAALCRWENGERRPSGEPALRYARVLQSIGGRLDRDDFATRREEANAH
jgi:transcriptional regulator with XRE-family HTH domain